MSINFKEGIRTENAVKSVKRIAIHSKGSVELFALNQRPIYHTGDPMITPCIHPESLRTMAKLEDSGRSHCNSVILPFPFSSFEMFTTGLRRLPLLGCSSKKKKY